MLILPVSIAGLLATKTQELVVHHCSTWTEIPRSSISASSTCSSRGDTKHIHSLKLTYHFPKRKTSSSNHPFLGANLLFVSGSVPVVAADPVFKKFWVLLVAELLAVKNEFSRCNLTMYIFGSDTNTTQNLLDEHKKSRTAISYIVNHSQFVTDSFSNYMFQWDNEEFVLPSWY